MGWMYHYSNTSMNWTQARQWCQSTYTDMVVIQSQKENDYLVSLLPNRKQSPYFWIGITKKQKNETWTWIGNNSTSPFTGRSTFQPSPMVTNSGS
uniref:C-type lectin domain-containing protein n=1 Tax=Cyclopterus lumpus TaxID=8103 RepID=A0A8C2WEN7_CYCLU